MTGIEFLGKYLINAELECLTGLHIGGTKDSIEIGGLDNPVVKDPVSDEPYIPGSSLKGKLRSILEFEEKKVKDGKPHTCSDITCPVCRVFGTTEGSNGLTRTIVRDAFLTNPKEIEGEDKSYTEIKTENAIDRIKGKALSPRTMERVPKSAKFGIELVYTLYNRDDVRFIKNLLGTFPILEDDTLGGSGSRGYGRVKFSGISIAYRPRDYYTGAATEKKAEFENFKKAAENFQKIEELSS